jgi:hypothetical protein
VSRKLGPKVFRRSLKTSKISIALSVTLLFSFFQVVESVAVETGTGNCRQDVDTATGVTVQEIGTECIVTFNVSSQATTITNTWTPPAGVNSVRVLVVGGGASGDRGQCGPFYGHGGGGGQVRDVTMPISPATVYSIQVGGGGAFGWDTGCPNVSGNHGSNSFFGSLTSYGGRAAIFNQAKGGDSGSLAYSGETSPTGGSAAGAGAGAGGPGGVGPSGATNLHGGRGIESNITNSVVMYGSGGAGLNSGVTSSAFSGGASSSTSAAANRGGGGTDPIGVSGRQNGAAGVVVIRYSYVTTCTPTESINDSSTVLTFNNVGTCNWQAPTSISSINVLLVGGGGGGGGWVAGGGGGGGVVQQQSTITSGNTYSISVAAGGRGTHVMGGTAISAGTNGGDTTAFGLTAFGGGLGATWTEYATGSRATGGGGGGSTGTGSAGSPDVSISPAQGFSGGTATGNSSFGFPTGGGGGAGGAGGNASGGVSGNGGAGRSSTISGTSTSYGGGGGGGCHGPSSCSNGNGINGGGNGSGHTSGLPTSGFSILGGNGTANTGGGGGGAGVPYSLAYNHAIGGSGGSGVVVISFVRYTSDDDFSLEFNGTNQYAYALDNSTFDIAGAITIQVWVNPAIASARSIIVRKEMSYQIYQQDGFWYFSVAPNGTSWSPFNTNIPVRANEWHHLAITRAANSNSAIFYYDGVAAMTGSGLGTAANRDSSDPFILGGWFSGGVYQSDWKYQGKMDHLQIYSSVRTPAQIAADMHTYVSPSTSNLRVSYDFNEGTRSRLFNRTSTATLLTDLILVNDPTWSDVKTVSTSDPYTTVKFLRSYITAGGGWKVPTGVTRVTALVVAGGGGGGSRHGGGGGAGGLAYGAVYPLESATVYSVVVGVGGIGYGQPGNFAYTSGETFVDSRVGPGGGVGTVGGNSLLRLSTSSTESITALGGGAGSGSGITGAGGSGGGSNQGISGGSARQYSGTNWIGYGNPGGQGSSGSCSSDWCGGGGGGAGASGVNGNFNSNGKAGNGGAGRSFTIESTTATFYAGGGGGGSQNGASVAAGGSGGGGAGGTASAGVSAGYATGGGGGGGGFWGNTDYRGGNGGSGVVIIRWITATAPTFTAPVAVDTTTAGTRYTFRVSGSATSPLIRNYQWQFSSNSGSSWTTLQASTSDSFTTTTLETTTSGITNRYRVIVTDSDTAGLSISDSRTSYLVINPAITITVDTSTITRDYGVATVKTFTFANGTGPRVATTSPPPRTGITWSNLNSDSATLTLAPTLTAGSYSETITVTDSVTATTSLRITITINKARQASLSIGQYNAFVNSSKYPINVYGGTTSAIPSRSLIDSGTAGCSIDSSALVTAARVGTCSVRAVKAGDDNYLPETATATIYWIQWSDAYATRTGPPTEIVLNHQTAITKYNYDTLTVTSYQNASKATVTTIGRGQTLRLVGDGFSSDSYIEVLFANMASRYIPPAGEPNRFSEMQVVTESGINFLQFTVPNDAVSGPVTVNSPKGTAVGPTLTITP